jgi:cytochrome c oxidase subunit 3
LSPQPSVVADHSGGIPSVDVTHAEPDVAEQFVDASQQHEAAELGMWLFLATEVMLFGAFFIAYLVYRYWYPEAFAVGSREMDVVLGTINTAILLTSSFTMALAVQAAEHGKRAKLVGLLIATVILGTLFLGIKGFEYYHKYADHLIPFAGWDFAPTGKNRAGLMTFFNLYFLMTGLHAFHMVIGISLLLALAVWAQWNKLPASRSIIVHNAGLYWHFVDLVWVYLFPFFYLVGNHPSSP